MRSILRLVWIAVGVAVGVVSALALFQLITWLRTSGNFAPWEELSPAPARAVGLLVDERGALFVEMSSEKTYRYTWGTEDEYWVRDEPAQDSSGVDPMEITQSCEFSSPELSRFRGVSEQIVDCVQIHVPEPEGFVKHTFVLDHGATVWHWHHAAAASGGIVELLGCVVVAGGIAGLLAGIGISNWVLKKRRAKA